MDTELDTKTPIVVHLYCYWCNEMKRDGWLKEPSGIWILRFRYDWESWDQKPKVLIDKGRMERNGIPLLKTRRRMRRNLAIKLWKDLLATGLEAY